MFQFFVGLFVGWLMWGPQPTQQQLSGNGRAQRPYALRR